MKILYIPIEIYKREFVERLYMALMALSRGYKVVLGEANLPIFMRARNGVLFYKDHARWSDAFFRRAKRNGLKICAFDEEGLIIGDVEAYKKARVSNWGLNNLDAIFCWGEVQKSILDNVRLNSDDGMVVDNIHVCGSPKIDIAKLYRSLHRTDEGQRGIKILINTRFSYNNGIYGDYDVDNLIHLGLIKTPEDLDNYKQLCLNEDKILAEFCKLIRLLGNSPEVEVTIRPHPLEREEVYNELASSFKNIVVDRQRDLRLQMLEVDVVVHDGCTTAIEARALGKPVLGLRPANLNPAYDDFSNQFSTNFISAEDLANYLVTQRYRDPVPDDSGFAQRHIANWEMGINATTRMIDVIDQVDSDSSTDVARSWIDHFDFKEVLFDLIHENRWISGFLERTLPAQFRRFVQNRIIVRNKFPSFDRRCVEELVRSLVHLDPALGRVNDLKLDFIGRRTLILQRVK